MLNIMKRVLDMVISVHSSVEGGPCFCSPSKDTSLTDRKPSPLLVFSVERRVLLQNVASRNVNVT